MSRTLHCFFVSTVLVFSLFSVQAQSSVHRIPTSRHMEIVADGENLLRRDGQNHGVDCGGVSYEDTVFATTCAGVPYYCGTVSVSDSGWHTIALQSKQGCDSTIHLHLTIYPQSYTDTIWAHVCDGAMYNEHGFNENIAGTYRRGFGGINDCDTVLVLYLTADNSKYDTIRASICEGDVYEEFGFNENSSGIYTHIATGISGCDSVTVLDLTVNPVYNDTIYDSVCINQTYTEHGFIADTTGFYVQHLHSAQGCDSIITLHLTVMPAYDDTIITSICSNETYGDYGFSETEAGVYHQYLQTSFGCDSTITLILSVDSAYFDTIRAEIYKGDTYKGFGFTESEKGFYTQAYQTVHGCDSLIVLDLKVLVLLFPNMVSPNGDGINDYYEVKNLLKDGAFPDNEFNVYSRYGRLVYQVKNINKPEDFWDPNQTNSPDGTYFFTFIGKGKVKTVEYRGVIEVAR